MQLECWKIHGNSFHFGQHGIGQESSATSMHSDSLFSALVSVLAQQEGSGAVEEWMRPFLNGAPPFVLTSTFPYAGELLFFPAPLILLSQEMPAGLPVKSVKKVRYFSEGAYRKVLSGSTPAEWLEDGTFMQNGEIFVLNSDAGLLHTSLKAQGGLLWQEEQRPRVTLGREVQNSALFFTGRIVFALECGLWFGVRWMKDEPALHEKLEALLKTLADAGLGAERSSGFGACTVTKHGEISLPDPRKKTWTNLSSYLPAEDETAALMDGKAAYRLRQVGGWLQSPGKSSQRRRSARLVTEGAVLGGLPKEVPGRIVDVRPSYGTDPDPLGHAVYRCGLTVAVGLGE